MKSALGTKKVKKPVKKKKVKVAPKPTKPTLPSVGKLVVITPLQTSFHEW